MNGKTEKEKQKKGNTKKKCRWEIENSILTN